MNSALMFSKASDEWETPQTFFDALDAEFHFAVDAAASRANRKCVLYFGPDAGEPYTDALTQDWNVGYPPWSVWLNPPYSRCLAFITKAAQEARKGCTVVCLIPSRTDTRMWHEHVWDASTHACRPGVEIRFIKGRLKFGGGKNSAPFPSCVVIFRPVAG